MVGWIKEWRKVREARVERIGWGGGRVDEWGIGYE